MLRQEVGIQDAGLSRVDATLVLLEQVLGQRLEQGLVAAHPDLYELIGDRGAVTDHTTRDLRVLEPHEAGLGKRVHGDDRRALHLRLLEGAQHARVVGAGVLPRDDDEAGVVDVFDRHRALADAERLRQRDAA